MNIESPPARSRQADESDAPLHAKPEGLEEAIARAEADARRRPGGRPLRRDGWTPRRIRLFLEAVADGRTAAEAAEAAGIDVRSAYRYANSAGGRSFLEAWDAAELLSRRRLADELMSRALHGIVERIVKDGVVVAERHRPCHRSLMSALTRLDNKMLARDEGSVTTRLIADEFEPFVDLVCEGGEGAGDFIRHRRREAQQITLSEAADRLERLGDYAGRERDAAADAPPRPRSLLPVAAAEIRPDAPDLDLSERLWEERRL